MLYHVYTASMDSDRKHKAEMRTSARPQASNKINNKGKKNSNSEESARKRKTKGWGPDRRDCIKHKSN